MKVAIISVNFNGKDDTLELLESLDLLKQDKLEIKIIVVDNGSSDGSVLAIRQKFPMVDIIQSGKNLGYSGGYNRGLEYACIWGADYYLLINNDCRIKDNNLLEELIKTAANPSVGLVSPKIYFSAGFEFHKNRYTKKDLGNVIWFGGGKFDWDNIGSIHSGLDEVDLGQYSEVIESEIISGACVLIKREVLDKVGFFDDRFFLYFEDSDFTLRTKKHGFKNYYNGTVAIYHKVSRSTGIGSEITDYYHSRNRLIFGMQYGRMRTKFALLREAIRLLINGRAAQRQGILDFFLGVTNDGLSQLQKKISKNSLEYPLKLSIGIVNYNTPELTQQLLESIFQQNSDFNPKTMEVIVLDNGNIDPAKTKIKKFIGKIKYLKNDENTGFSKGYNKTIRYSLGEYYLMLNSDVKILPNGLTELIKWADYFKGEAVLGGKLLFPDGSNQDSAFHLPTIWGAFQEYFLQQKGAYFMYQPKGERFAKVVGLVMACLLIPQKVLKKVGLLDENSFIFFEDIEYARRLQKYHIPTYFIPSAKFIHHHGASTKKIGLQRANDLLKQSAEYYHGSIRYFFLSWVLRIGQRFGRVKTPVSRWTKKEG